jgi:8-oxo-dGTP pyrophosphatase MutT (NUDIX family)
LIGEAREKPMREKVVAYVTHGDRLLVFTHLDFPDAGVQVPVGTIEPGEQPAETVLREACEETGLCDLEIRACLGVQDRRFVRDGIGHHHRRHYYHLIASGTVADRWRHLESHPSSGGPDPIAFDLYWVRVPDGVPELAGDLGVFLGDLSLGAGGSSDAPDVHSSGQSTGRSGDR